MKRYLLVIVGLILVLAACAAPGQDISGDDLFGSEQAYLGDDPVSEDHTQNTYQVESENDEEVSGLSEGEISGIIFMREEEKLARDVYLYLADLWGMNIFANIADSEDTHMGAVLSLIDMGDLEDPAQGMGYGDFFNEELQSLYNELISRGEESLAEALLVGAAIEEIDILDLQKFLAETDDQSIAEVYQNLLNGSINHLNSFVRTYERQTGEEYQPQYLTEDAFQDLLTAASQGGGGVGQGRSERSQAWGKSK